MTRSRRSLRSIPRAALATALATATALALAAALAPAPVAAQTARMAKRVVVIDAGHGGVDPGMRGRLPTGAYVYEKDINLSVARRLADLLKKKGVDVFLTRTRDTLINLLDRGRIANQAHGDLFVSIHVNAPGSSERNPKAVRGFETYFLAEAKTEDERRVEAMENSVVRFETSAPVTADDPLAFILNDMAQNEHLRESYELAGLIQEVVSESHPGPDRGVKQASLAVLRTAYMPAVLIEMGFGSNANEALWLSSSSGQNQLAADIAQATLMYLESYERRIRAAAQR